MSPVDTTTNAGQLLATASGGRRRRGDRIFSNTATMAAVTILALLAGVAIFLVTEGFPALTASAAELPKGESFLSYVAPLAFGTCLAGVLAMVIAVPLAVAVALFITHIAPPRIASPSAILSTYWPRSRASSTASGASSCSARPPSRR